MPKSNLDHSPSDFVPNKQRFFLVEIPRHRQVIVDRHNVNRYENHWVTRHELIHASHCGARQR